MADQNTPVDLFGKLPDEVLCRVISFLPSETAIETTFLSKRWNSLWDCVSVKQTTLDLISQTVSEFASGFENSDPLTRPRKLKLLFGHGRELLASLASNNKLKLEFSHDLTNNPSNNSLFSSEFRFSNHLQSDVIKVLNLKSLDSLTNDSVCSMVSRFRCLERLKIAECGGLKSLTVEGGQKLVSLTVLDCPDLESLRLVKCSKLRSFRYRGKVPRIWLEDHFNLVDAMFDFRRGIADHGLVSGDFDHALLTVKNSQILTLCSSTFETLIWPSLSPMKESFQFYRLKELWWIGYSEEDYCDKNINSLIHFLKLCPALERLFVTIDPNSHGQPNTSTCTEKLGSRRIEIGKLKMVKMEGFVNKENEIRLIKEIREILSVDPLFISDSNTSANLSLESLIPTHAQISV